MSQNNTYYYFNEETKALDNKYKRALLKVVNPLLETGLRFKRVDRVLLKSMKFGAKKLKLNNERVKQSKVGTYYKQLSYRSHYKRQARKYISDALGIEGFFNALNDREINYVILRWFEDLPNWPAGEDIDLLIDDDDLARIMDLFNQKPEGTPMDTYTVKGRKGCAFGIAGPYYPPVLAEEILANKKFFKNRFYVPNKKYHFLSLLYHIVYHKAERSGLPLSEKTGKKYAEVDHDYETIIRAFPQSVELGSEIHLTLLHEYLKKHDFMPNIDTLRKLAMKESSAFLFNLAREERVKGIEPYDLIVFFVREWAFSENAVVKIIDTISKHDLEIISYYYLTGDTQKRVTQNVRGGNWHKGPYPVDGGEAKLAIIAFDPKPKKVHFDLMDSHPFVENENVFIKGKVRDTINDQLIVTKWVNSIHSSDDFTEAKEYIDLIDPLLFDVVMRRVDQRKRSKPAYNHIL